MTPQLLDISHHNSITSRAQVPDLPIVHKVNEGTAVDREVRDRLPWITGRNEIFGGYTVLIVSRSTIREQLERYAETIGPYWRDGAITQLDIEPWERYDRPVSAEEIVEAGVVHDELFGPDRFLAYLNPNQLTQQYAELDRSGWLAGRLWLPNYSRNGPTEAVARRAVIHQYTSTAPVAGFAHGIDANTILQPDRLRQIANLTPPPPVHEEDDMIEVIQVDGDVAQYERHGFTARWAQSGAEKQRDAQELGFDPRPRNVDRSYLRSLTLVGPQPQGAGVTTSYKDFAGHTA